MERKCRNCLCRTCMESCKCQNCGGKIKECKRYVGFRQTSVFKPPPEPTYQPAPRQPWEYYGLEDKEYRKKLYIACRSGKHDRLIRRVAYQTSECIAEYIIKSVTQDKSYDKIEFDAELGRICVGKSDFYGYRRLFYSLMDKELRRIGK